MYYIFTDIHKLHTHTQTSTHIYHGIASPLMHEKNICEENKDTGLHHRSTIHVLSSFNKISVHYCHVKLTSRLRSIFQRLSASEYYQKNQQSTNSQSFSNGSTYSLAPLFLDHDMHMYTMHTYFYNFQSFKHASTHHKHDRYLYLGAL